ncbi:autotransporter domain-containing protein [Vibrio alfacsensis]|uniref:autotransporter domain-containing protein n=1 Tax=Vibrio alfacsensis TaxID=1074311 RepID=UPI001BF14D93|nr:autotransporter domain-containing protein [Vibrio alfacsensis]BCN26399.1 hypothetical protein VYA_35910 [Vibrio alfacsensis]
MNKAVLALALAATFGAQAAYLAEETNEVVITAEEGLLGSADSAPNPSDLTQVNSFVFGTIDNDGTLKGMVGLAGQYSEGNNFMGLIEHGTATKNNSVGKKDQNSRLRYFQVLDTDMSGVPQVGFSVDYMKGWEKTNGFGSDLVALGGIAKVTTPWDALSIFPNVAYVTGEGKTKESGSKGKIDVSGYQLNIFGSLALGESGEYIVVQPQFMHLDGKSKVNGQKLDGKLDANVFKVKTGYGQPISTDGKWWVEVSHTYTRTNMEVKQTQFSEKDNDHKFEFGVSYYF